VTEGYESVVELKGEGRIGAVSFGIYPIALWKRIFASIDIDPALIWNHYGLNDIPLLALLPVVREKGIGIVNGSPFASGLLTDRGPADWHPAGLRERLLFRETAKFCQAHGTFINRLAFQFSSQNPDIPATFFSTANAETVRRNVSDHEQFCDMALIAEVQKILFPVLNQEWSH
jgi:L-galactose dehydrogenase